MYFVYLLKSAKDPEKTYVGYTADLRQRLETHNSGGSVHTAHSRPWKLVTFICFDSKMKALSFEKYLKSGSGNSFAQKRLW